MALFTPVKATATSRERPNRVQSSNLFSFCTPSKQHHFEDSDEEDKYPNTIIKSRSAKQDLTPATVNESPLSSAESVGRSPKLMSLSSHDDGSASTDGIPKRLGFEKPSQISFDKKSNEKQPSSLTANCLVLAFALLLLRLIMLERSAVNVNIRLSPQMTQFKSLEDYQQATRQFVMPNIEGIDQLPDINDFKFYKLDKDESGTFLASVQGKDLLGPPRPFSRRWLMQKCAQIKDTSAFLKEKSAILKETSEDGLSEVLQDDHLLI